MRDSPSGKSEQAVERNSSPRASQLHDNQSAATKFSLPQMRLVTAPPRRRVGMGRRRTNLRSRAKGTGYATVRSPSKAQPLLNPALLELE